MADHADEEDDGVNVFVYRGGRAPRHVTHVRIDKSVEVIEDNAFDGCEHLVQVETHDGIRRIGGRAFNNCESLRWINLKHVAEIGEYAFCECDNLECAEFGDKLEIIENDAFADCISLKHLKLPSIIVIGNYVFYNCSSLRYIELSGRLETIEAHAFEDCDRLERIAIPLKRDLIEYDDLLNEYNQFNHCFQLTKVDLVGGIHKTVASLHMESWRSEMEEEINRINQVLPNTPFYDKTDEIRQWMDAVLDKMDHYKAEHYRYVKEGMTLLELALWKAKLDEKEDISENAFRGCEHLVQVETHDGIRRVGDMAFRNCESLRRINLKSVVEISEYAFYMCENLADVEFGDKLEIIESDAFHGCSSLKRLNLPFIITIGAAAFWGCSVLTDVDISERIETIEKLAFSRCERLKRISIPLKSDLFAYDDLFERYNQFDRCDQLTQIDLVGEIHKTVASLHMESWRSEMEEEINRINQVLPNTPAGDKTDEIRQWMHSVLDKIDYFKAEHCRYVEEAITLLELALWKSKLDEKEDSCAEGTTEKAKVDDESARKRNASNVVLIWWLRMCFLFYNWNEYLFGGEGLADRKLFEE
ncbi:leucine-rich repeat domain-containing protein [Skeletonema marinoi]|uniref:Leucine-rich repeat domain-containing protein n=1 Tax=Skeletonema marinoi TaxID=267567 RepID=A0AAD8Y317_9STRA|nr:leucine-rich repeat domain-containing protein [Skeletonema marinoi]